MIPFKFYSQGKDNYINIVVISARRSPFHRKAITVFGPSHLTSPQICSQKTQIWVLTWAMNIFNRSKHLILDSLALAMIVGEYKLLPRSVHIYVVNNDEHGYFQAKSIQMNLFSIFKTNPGVTQHIARWV